MDFDRHIITLINDCISSPKFLILIEGQPTDQFISGRGLHQGDPLSSSLFNIVLEMLSQEFRREEEEGNIDNFVVGGVKLVAHLLFADDLLIFSKGNFKSINTVKRILQRFRFSSACL